MPGAAIRWCRCRAGCPSCSSEGAPSNVAPVYARMVASASGEARRAAGWRATLTQLPVPRDRLVTLGEGDTPLMASHGARRRARPAPAVSQGRAAEPDRQLARPVRGAGGVADRGLASRRWGRPATRRWRSRWPPTPRGPACGRSAWSTRRSTRAPATPWRRSAGGSWRCDRPPSAGRFWPTPSGRWAGGRSRTARRLRSAAIRCRSRATARSPTRSSSSCASPRPTWSIVPGRASGTASRGCGADFASWSPGA